MKTTKRVKQKRSDLRVESQNVEFRLVDYQPQRLKIFRVPSPQQTNEVEWTSCRRSCVYFETTVIEFGNKQLMAFSRWLFPPKLLSEILNTSLKTILSVELRILIILNFRNLEPASENIAKSIVETIQKLLIGICKRKMHTKTSYV